MNGAYVAGMGYHHPQTRVTNADLALTMDTSDEWIREHTGIVERRYAEAGIDTSDLGVLATSSALEDAGWDPAELELLVCTTSTPDALLPPTAAYICEKLGLRSTVAFDLNASCSGFVYGLAVAQGLLASQGHRRVAVCAAEKYSRVIDNTDRRNAIFWGDSGATILLQPERPLLGAQLVDISLTSRNEGADLVKIPLQGTFTMDGPAVKRIAFEGLVESSTEILERNGLRPQDIRVLVAHQANLRTLESLGDALGIDGDRQWHNVEHCGNQGAAGIATTLAGGVEARAGELRDGDLFLLSVYGSGFSGGSALLRWLDGRELPSAGDPAADAARA